MADKEPQTKAGQDIKKWLEYEEYNYGFDEKLDNEIFYFGVKGDNQLYIMFVVEKDADVIQFRIMSPISDDDIKEKLKAHPERELKLTKYLLKKNYDYKLGKWGLDDDYSLQFSLPHYEKAENGVETALLRRVKKILFDSGDDMVTEIKNILDGKEPSEKKEAGLGDIAKMLEGLDPEKAALLLEALKGASKSEDSDDSI